MATEAQIIANRRNAQKSTSTRSLSMSLGLAAAKRFAKTSNPADCFMQNKANLLDAQMNVCSVKTKYYENKRLSRRGENKPNQTQFHTQRLGFFGRYGWALRHFDSARCRLRSGLRSE